MPAYRALGYDFRLDDGLDPTLLQLFDGLRLTGPEVPTDSDLLAAHTSTPISEVSRLLLAMVAQRASAAASGMLILGGGCVSRPDGASMIVCGPQGSGRTILTARAAVRGFAYSADTLVCIDPLTMRITRYRPPLRIRAELQDLAPEWRPQDATAGAGLAGDWLIPAGLLAELPAAQTLFPDLLAFPELRLGEPTRLTLLTEAETAYRLGAASIGLGEVADPAGALCRLARRAPGYHLQVGSIEESVTQLLALWGGDA